MGDGHLAAGSGTLQGGNQNDDITIYGGTSDVTLDLGDGDDNAFVETRGKVFIDGGEGNDSLAAVLAGHGHSTLSGEGGDDYLWSSGGFSLDGGAGDDQLNSVHVEPGTPANLLYGGDGADVLGLSPGDTATGGEGADGFAFMQDLIKGVSPDVAAIEITDFDPGVDLIEFGCDLGLGNEVTIADLPGGSAIVVDGTIVVQVDGISAHDLKASEGLIIRWEAWEMSTQVAGHLSTLDDWAFCDWFVANSITAMRGDDTVQGSSLADTVFGDGGNDSILGESGDDSLVGGQGRDNLSSDDGDDITKGGDGADTCIGSEGADALRGGNGSDLLAGFYIPTDGTEFDGQFDPNVYGSQADSLFGGNGDDHLILETGDQGTGGAGADWFEVAAYEQGLGPAVIHDFDGAEDHLSLTLFQNRYGGAGKSDLTASVDAGTGDITISVKGDVVAVLEAAQNFHLLAVDIVLI